MILKEAKSYQFYDSDAAERFKALSLDGMKAVFIYSPNVYADGRAVRYDAADRGVRTVAVSGEVYAPVSLFTDHLGAEVVACDGVATVSHGGRSVQINTYDSNGVICLPVISSAEAIGYAAKGYYEGRLVVVGTPMQIAAMDTDADMQTAGAYLLFGKYDP